MQAKISRLSSSVLLMACSFRGFKRKTVNIFRTCIFYKSPNAASPFQFQCGQWRDDVLWQVIISSHVAFFNRKNLWGFFPLFFYVFTKQVKYLRKRKHAGVECSSARFQHLLPNGLCGVFHKRHETTGCRRDRGFTREFYGLLLEQDLQHCCP